MITVSTTSEAERQDVIEALTSTDAMRGHTVMIYLMGKLVTHVSDARPAGYRRGTALPEPGPPHPANEP